MKTSCFGDLIDSIVLKTCFCGLPGVESLWTPSSDRPSEVLQLTRMAQNTYMTFRWTAQVQPSAGPALSSGTSKNNCSVKITQIGLLAAPPFSDAGDTGAHRKQVFPSL